MTPTTEPGAPTLADILGHVHLIGIGGAGMSAIARILLARGVTVSGSDAQESATTGALREAGARIFIGHDAANVTGATTLVVSTAIRESNPELAAARAAGARVLHRSEALAATMTGKRPIAIAGTHGKTTTTAMVTVMLQHAGAEPSFAVGGNVASLGVNAEYGQGEDFVFEADESDGSFVNFDPAIEVITNAEADHLDHYGSAEAVFAAFHRFIDKLQPGGTLIVCADDPGAMSLIATHPEVRVITYGTDPGADVQLMEYTAHGAGSASRIRDRAWGGDYRLNLQVPGEHNMRNALAAYCVGRSIGVSAGKITTALGTFSGAARRFELKGEAGGVRVFDDYSHHPTEVRVALQAARAVAGSGRVLVLFQPHLYSRTREFAAEFADALQLADRVWVLPIYGAREDPVPGVSNALITERSAGDALVAAEREEAIAAVLQTAQDGDIILTMGAGDVTQLGPLVVDGLRHATGNAVRDESRGAES
ncbi:UDP-N-acetylmuramate--L-alanine ligase [Haematomicrobium sanguinis]|uniref:UDP-N-acetylmuramate--L-alanine ligase n=1 Tax=Haematomicrobium sanguinis TaxID=479106 RepID=UPI00068BB882|nr:UDP-N-acetylmuramate--L-alanine ligase [Haematomicrobium sanguinis]